MTSQRLGVSGGGGGGGAMYQGRLTGAAHTGTSHPLASSSVSPAARGRFIKACIYPHSLMIRDRAFIISRGGGATKW